MKINKHWICVGTGIFFAVIMMLLTYRSHEVMAQQDLAGKVLRFHVLANSDSDKDQKLKMQVKEAILDYMEKEIPAVESVAVTTAWAKEHLSDIENVAREQMAREAYEYEVKAEVTSSYFPEKSYGDITFPAGEYYALRVEIGKGEGQNWWCVLYPNLCFLDATHAYVPEEGKKALESVLEEETYEQITAVTDFQIQWFFF